VQRLIFTREMITSLSSNYKPLSECHQSDRDHYPSTTSDNGYPSSSRAPSGGSGNHEMTRISVISPNNNNSAAMDTVVVHHQPDCHVLAKHKLAGVGGDLFSSSNRRTTRGGGIVWTNFHCMLCLGLSGFFIFWTAILLRMYLPVDSFLMDWWLGAREANRTNTENGKL